MKRSCSWIILPLALGLPFGNVCQAQSPPPTGQSPVEASIDPTVVLPPESEVAGLPPMSYFEAHRGETTLQVESIRQKIRAAQRMPTLPALAALSADDTALRDVTRTLSPGQCQELFQQAVVSDSNLLVADALLESLLQRSVKGLREKVARWLSDPSNDFPQPRQARKLARGAIMSWGQIEPQQAANLAAAVPLDKAESDNPFSLSHILVDFCADWASRDPISAGDWAGALTDADPRKVDALDGTMAYFNEFYPEKAKAWVAQLSGINEQAPELAETVAARLAQLEFPTKKNPPATMQWALAITDVPMRRAALRSVLNTWVPGGGEESIAQAKQWATTLPPAEFRGAAWGAFSVAWQSWDNHMIELAGGSPEFFEQFKTNGISADDWLRNLPAGADRDEAMSIREKFEASILNQRIWR